MTRSQPILLQAQDEEDRKSWLEAMDGKEPVSSSKTCKPQHVFMSLWMLLFQLCQVMCLGLTDNEFHSP